MSFRKDSAARKVSDKVRELTLKYLKKNRKGETKNVQVNDLLTSLKDYVNTNKKPSNL